MAPLEVDRRARGPVYFRFMDTSNGLFVRLARVTLVGSALALSAAAIGCSKEQQAPVAAPAVDQPGYAAKYPDELGKLRARFDDQEGRARRSFGTFSTFPDELQKPNWSDVMDVYDAAVIAGQRSEYAERAKETEAISEFFDEEKTEINAKVGGAANYQAKQKSCDVDVSGATSNALEKTVQKQLEKRLREDNEAHRIIDDREDSIGKPNREKLEHHADEISLASYLTHVGLEETRRDLVNMVQAGNDAKSTLDKSIEKSRAETTAAGRSDAEKKKAQARLDAAEAAKAKIDTEVQEAQKVLEGAEDRMKKLKDEFDKAITDLKQKVEAKKSEAPPAA